MMMMNGHMMGPWGWLLMLIFWVLVIAALVYGVRWLARRNHQSGDMEGGTPLEILKKRYASGEIDREEFERMKKDLAE